MGRPRVIGGKYALGGLLGRGGMGEVYEATEEGSGRRVALKLMRRRNSDDTGDGDESEREWGLRFEREVRAIGDLRSPHIVRVHDSGTDAITGDRYMVMERLDGEDLSQLGRRIAPLPEEAALRIIAQALLGLEKAHEAGVVHRDIKPANLFLTKNEGGGRSVRILDFGVARVRSVSGETDVTDLTRTGSMIGSPTYMSPEQARGSKGLDARADIWSMGVVLYQLLAGSIPHERRGAGLGDYLITICCVPAPSIQKRAPWVSREIANIVHKALRIPADERYASARAFYEEIVARIPDRSLAIEDGMLVPLSATMKAHVAPLADIPTLIEESGATETRTAAAIAHTTPPPKPARSPMWLAAGGAVVGLAAAAVLVVGGGAFRHGGDGNANATSNAVTPAAPVVSAAPAPVDIQGQVHVPADATVEVDGVATPVAGETLMLHGAAGTTHRVHVVVGSREVSEIVALTDQGAVPGMITVGSDAPPATPPTTARHDRHGQAGQAAKGATTATATPPAAPAPSAAPLRDKFE